MTGPLEGVRVVELAEGIAGPMAGRFLGDAGADVVKVEVPGGDRARGWGPVQVNGASAAFQTVNRNKRGIVLEPGEREELEKLLGTAEVLIVAHGQVDVDALGEAYPSLVIGVVSAWGPDGPWVDRPGGELPAQLSAEVTASLGRIGEEPVRLGHEHGAITAGFHLSQGILAALLAVDEVGGQRIDVSLFGSLVQMRSTLWVAQSNPDEWWGFHLDSYVKPPEHGYTCKDTRIYLSAARVDNFDKLISELNMDFAREDPRWETFRKDTAGFTARHTAAVHDIWDRGLSQWTYAEAAAIVRRNGGDAYPVYSYANFVGSAQARHLGIFQEVALDSGEVWREVRPPWQFSATPATIRRPAPGLGQHTGEVRFELDPSRPPVAQTNDARPRRDGEETVELRPGTRLKSLVDATEVIVVKPPNDPAAVIRCGGAAMVPATDTGTPRATLDPAAAGGSLLGKRYIDEATGVELLCTRPGEGTLAVDDRELLVKAAIALPTTD